MSNMLEKVSDNLPKVPKKQAKPKKKASSQKTPVAISLMAVLIILMAFGSYALIKSGIEVGTSALMNSYSVAYASEKNSAYQAVYQSAYNRAKKNYHVSNTVVVSLGNLEELQKLEVLRANDVEFITEDRDNNSGNVTAWLEVEGEGTFVIDLQAAEFIIDNDRRYVLARIPNPELTNINIIKTTRRLFADDWMDGSYREGVDLALKQRNEASLQIQKALLSNQYIFSNAQDVAIGMVENLIRQFNSDIPDLTVKVEFMD